MERYWSPVHELRKSPLPTVIPTSERARLRREVMARVIEPSIPVAIITPPKSMADTTR